MWQPDAGEQLEELRHVGHVEVGDLLLHHLGRAGGRPGQRAEHVVDAHACCDRAGCIAVLPTKENLRSPIVALLMMSKPQKVKNRWVSMPSPSCGVGEDEAGVGHVEVALGADDRELATLLCGASKDGTIGVLMSARFSRWSGGHAVWLGRVAGGSRRGGVARVAHGEVRRSPWAWAARRRRPSSWPACRGRGRRAP
jgi:hypothetical protein